jgi:hypothetical protein
MILILLRRLSQGRGKRDNNNAGSRGFIGVAPRIKGKISDLRSSQELALLIG